MQYQHDRVGGGYLALAAITGDPDFIDRQTEQAESSTDDRVLGSYLCKVSQQPNYFGIRPAPPIQSDVIWESASAVNVLQWQVSRNALPKRVVQYEAPNHWEWLPLGSVVVVTDSEVSLTSRLALLTDYTYGAGSLLLELTLLDHPVHHTRNIP